MGPHLYTEAEKFRRKVAVCGGSDEQAMLILFAWASDTATGASKTPLSEYIKVVVGDDKQRASERGSTIEKSGKVPHRIGNLQSQPGRATINIMLKKATISDINSILRGTHPLAVATKENRPFDFTSGAELIHIPVRFSHEGSDFVFVLTLTRRDNDIGQLWYVSKDGDLLETSRLHLGQQTIIGSYGIHVEKLKTTFTVWVEEDNVE
jgi:hypothetical protein